MSLDTHVCIIGSGVSGICTAIQVIRQYNTRNFTIIEKSQELGGTWSVNTYPGCGCDVPSHFYSFSFALKPDWTQKYAMQPEILAYLKDVSAQYELHKHIRFGTTTTQTPFSLRSKILVSAVGGLSIPKQCEIPGASTFKGKIFHSAQWDHSFNWEDRTIVVVGNGCSATQFVPVISSGQRSAKNVVQFANQAHWLAERQNPQYSATFQWMMRWVPLAMRAYRGWLYWNQEKDFRAFDIESGSRYQYADFLVPKTEIGCKRRVNDTDYLSCLHHENVQLVYDDPIQDITPRGVRTKSGRIVTADAIILATGFQTQRVLTPMQIYGQRGVSVNDHWQNVSKSIPSAYLGTCLAGFPNFFIMMGPNTLSGHLSVIYTTECQVNFTMRLIHPIMKNLASAKLKNSNYENSLSTVGSIMVTPEAETRDLAETQVKARRLVWASGCSSWFLDPATGRNFVMFPDWQYKFWIRSVWIPWSDFVYRSGSSQLAVE
ncbi:FAD/NAD(P)-binding domain-containing protein [Xylariaceae sp. FL1651]|nr:FAD/NAD(P)-binding domain-containing protein [Xylariaceae sp. FL1651]